MIAAAIFVFAATQCSDPLAAAVCLFIAAVAVLAPVD